jgi:putative endonuclease
VNTQARRKAQSAGRLAEIIAAWLLRFKGYSVLARGYRHHSGEIDIMAKRGRVLAAVEVKLRPDFTAAAEAVSARQRARIMRAAEAFLASRPDANRLNLRFDVVLMVKGRFPRHIEDAWRSEI